MSILFTIPLIFVVFFGWTLWCSYKGYDDVIYQYKGRKPSNNEGITRIYFVIIKSVAVIFGGCILVTFIYIIFYITLNIKLNYIMKWFFIFTSMLLMSIFIGLVQNKIRSVQGREKRPPLDIDLIKYNLNRWVGR
jgi:uncharacterized Tic20 family protein